jgi:hypothetical protein
MRLRNKEGGPQITRINADFFSLIGEKIGENPDKQWTFPQSKGI